MSIQKVSIVTIDISRTASNTFLVDTVEENDVLVKHPLAPNVLLRFPKHKIDTVNANVKDSSERCIDYAKVNERYLDHNDLSDLEALSICFAVNRKLSPRQKKILSSLCGTIASGVFNNDLREAMTFITKNHTVLDEFNTMWYKNFAGLFSGDRYITSKKQHEAIYNIAGYALAQLENPTIPKQR